MARTSVFAKGKNLAAGGIYFRRGFEKIGAPAGSARGFIERSDYRIEREIKNVGYSKKKGRPGRLPCWDYSAVGCYFITFCTKDRRCILSQVVGRDDFGAPSVELTSYGAYLLHLLNSLPNAYPNVKLHHSVIMPNHVHLLFSIEPHALSAPGSSRSTQLVPRMIEALKRFTNQFAGFNLWQSTYCDHIIRNEADYLRIWDYIDTNPAKWREDCYYCQPEGATLP